tara:strand:- start:709 stop:2025 length:1317 start_codon:yes stop_codon:yes gene_type:complete
MSLSVIVLAAGKGERMNSKKPKVFHHVGNHPMIYHVLDVAKTLNPKFLSIILSKKLTSLKTEINQKYKKVLFAIQQKQLGTADAVNAAFNNKNICQSDVTLILYADTPLISNQTLKKCIAKFKSKKMDLCILSMRPKNANHSYGRLQMVGSQLKKIIEKSELQGDQKKIEFCNSGIMIIKTDLLSKNLKRIDNNNNKKEFYLTDIVEIMSEANFKVGCEECGFVETLGVNDKTDLSLVEEEFQIQARKKFLKQGVTLIDPDTVYFSYDTQIGKDVVIHPNVYFGPGVSVGNNVILKSFSHVENSIISNNATIGPFARTRDHTVIGEDARVGNFVEIKKSKIDKNVKASHLSYIGDAVIDENTNIGAGTITCNYDGITKHKTLIGENCFIGSNTSLIAPIKIKKNSIIGAGTVIKKDVPIGTTVYRKSELIKKNNKKKK